MRGGTVALLMGLTALGAYALGRQDAGPGRPSNVTVQAPAATDAPVASKPWPLVASPTATPAPPSPASASSTSVAPSPSAPPRSNAANPTPQPNSERKVEAVLTAAAIAALLVKASRDQYHATGRPCACPDDTMRNGRACGGRSAYARPGGAAPLCYPHDITSAMIEDYRKRAVR
jgi:hypothetical protein